VARPAKFWAKVRAAYRRGEGSIAALAEQFGVPESTLEKRARKEKWTAQRREVGAKAEAKVAAADVDAAAAAISQARSLVDGVAARAGATLAAVDLFDPEGLKHVSAVVSQILPHLLRLSGVDPEKPIAVPGAEAPKQRIVVRGGAALAPETSKPDGAP
jgi:transposase-like protein